MKRRKVLKSMAMSALTVPVLNAKTSAEQQTQQEKSKHQTVYYQSQWQHWPNMSWIGAEYWANRLQDWEISEGELKCNLVDKNRSAHLLTHQLNDSGNFMQTSIRLRLNESVLSSKGQVGWLWGAKGRFDDYRSAALTGKGQWACIDTEGKLHLGEMVSHKPIEPGFLAEGIELKFYISSDGMKAQADLSVWYKGNPISTLRKEDFTVEEVKGNIALYSDFQEAQPTTWSVAFSDWDLSGDLLDENLDQTYGPVCFTQYTQEAGILKLTAQLAPMEGFSQPIRLSIQQGESWKEILQSPMVEGSYTAHFRSEDWDATKDYPFKVSFDFPRTDGQLLSYEYTGTIVKEPTDASKVKMLALSCNWDLGFPDDEFGQYANTHNADLAVFLGDQFYEANAGFGIQMEPHEKAVLDYLRKWYLFGWAHRELFRHRPSICLPDDHDVYHGNIWGEGGKATIKEGGSSQRQDTGGYKMPGEWVNIVQTTQTSHMPDAYDPTPIKQGITVYYTSWKYGGIDFGIIEDRKFKSAPKNIFPKEAEVFNGYVQNQQFDILSFNDQEKAELLGERQNQFLQEWVEDWSGGIHMKILLSATSFMTMQTLPKGTMNDQVTPKLPIPVNGEYVEGDYFTRDMDSNGWPQVRRDEVVRLLRKAYVTHVVGDQHLASVAQYGVEEYRDSGFAFTVPAIASVWPRRWWPPVSTNHRAIPGRKLYTGDFKDGFGNKITVFSAANPMKTNKSPELLYDRATGYGVVLMDKITRRIRFECWNRYTDPKEHPQGQYDDWPVEISQLDNFASNSSLFLPKIKVKGLNFPVVKVYKSQDQSLVSVLRMPSTEFQLPVLESGTYLIKVGDPDRSEWKEQSADTDTTNELIFEFES